MVHAEEMMIQEIDLDEVAPSLSVEAVYKSKEIFGWSSCARFMMIHNSHCSNSMPCPINPDSLVSLRGTSYHKANLAITHSRPRALHKMKRTPSAQMKRYKQRIQPPTWRRPPPAFERKEGLLQGSWPRVLRPRHASALSYSLSRT